MTELARDVPWMPELDIPRKNVTVNIGEIKRIDFGVPLSEDRYLDQLKSIAVKAFDSVCKDNVERENFLRKFLNSVGYGDNMLPVPTVSAVTFALPSEAPVLWLKRADRQQTPPNFIRDIYQPWLGKGLTRAHIFNLDKPLYNALAKWLQQTTDGRPESPKNQFPEWLDLPTKAEQTTRRLSEIGTPSASEWLGQMRVNADPAIKERMRLHEAARSRQRRAAIITPT